MMFRKLLTLGCALLVTSQLAAQDPPPAPPPGPWTGSVGAGLAITSGNSDTTNFNAALNVLYDPKTRFLFKSEALVLRGSTDGETQVDRAVASGRGEYTISDRTFAFGELGYLRDPFKEIEYLIAPVAGAGYRIIRSDTRNLTVDGAVGMQIESNTAGGSSTDGAVKAGQSFDWAFSPTSKVTQKLTGLWTMDDFADAFYHFETGLAMSVMTNIELKLTYAYDHQTRPLPGIEEGDSALFGTFLYKF